MTRRALITLHAASIALAAGALALEPHMGAATSQRVAAPDVPGGHPVSKFEYVGNRQCRMCHARWYRSWLESAKGGSWEALRPGVAAETKRNAGLAVSEDYRTNSECLRCHAVGHGERGGYDPPPNALRGADRDAGDRQGAGCESCHGPGSEFVRVMRDVLLTGRPYRREDLRAAGCRNVGPDVCLECHNRTATCQPERYRGVSDAQLRERLSAAIEAREGFHARFPLKHRGEPKVTDASPAARDPAVTGGRLSRDPSTISYERP
jgi:hypothetical protein